MDVNVRISPECHELLKTLAPGIPIRTAIHAMVAFFKSAPQNERQMALGAAAMNTRRRRKSPPGRAPAPGKAVAA